MKTKLTKSAVLFFALFSFSVVGSANQAGQQQGKSQTLIEYEAQLSQGKSYRDAFEALQYEIAYEQAAVHSKSPCRKMVRGL